MNAALDFAVLPPEVNSARMYCGVGSGPMLAAASAWNGLAAELRCTALSYSSVLSELISQQWHGPASAAMAAAATPYVVWLSTTAAQAEQTAAQAEAAVAAYESAFAATVPPPVIAANRAQLMALIATNILGQNTPAIAAAESHYAEMWAQDAAAMYSYAASSALASQLTAFTEPQQTASASALSAQSVAATPDGIAQSTLAQLISSLPSALQGLATPAASGSALGTLLDDLSLGILAQSSGQSTSGLAALLNLLAGADGSALGQFLNANGLNSIFASGFFMPARFLGNVTDFMGLGGKAAGQASGDVADAAASAAAAPLGDIEAMGNAVSAGLGRSSIVGSFSAPAGWTAAPLHSSLSPALGATPTASQPAVAAGLPGVPPRGAMGGQGDGHAIPQYGFRPTFVARPPAAG
jgi:PPE-repeat protein